MVTFRRLATDSAGAAIAEAAAILPILFMVLMAIYSFGRAYNIYSTINRAAQEGAAVAARSNCGSCGNQLTTPVDVFNAVSIVMQGSRIDAGGIASNALSPAPPACDPDLTSSHDTQANIDIYRNVQLNVGSTGPPICGAIVTFTYPYQLVVPFTSVNFSTVTLTAAAERQMEN
jgi:Flp pilus assembly protein TadG